jgi:chromosome segregation ATPase
MSEEHGFSDEDRQQVAQSLESIVRIVLSKELEALRDSIADVDSRMTERKELEALRDSIADVETRVSERVVSFAESTTSRMDQMRDHVVPGFEEIRSKLTELDESREQTESSLEERLAEAARSMKEEIQGVSDGLGDSRRQVETLREELNESKLQNATLMEAAEKSENEIETLREELRRPRDQIKALEEAVEEPKKQLQSVQDELRALTDQLQEIREQSSNRIEVVKATLEQEIAGGDANLMEQLNGIVGDFNQLQNQMTQQTKTSQHLSGVLNNLASIFTTKGGAPPSLSVPAAPAGDAPESEAKADESTPSSGGGAPKTEGGNSELENALNRVFPLES